MRFIRYITYLHALSKIRPYKDFCQEEEMRKALITAAKKIKHESTKETLLRVQATRAANYGNLK